MKKIASVTINHNTLNPGVYVSRIDGDITTYDIKVIRNGEGKETTYTLLPSLPTEFDIKEGIEEVDLAEIFKAPEKEVILQLMEGKTYKEIYGNNENED